MPEPVFAKVELKPQENYINIGFGIRRFIHAKFENIYIICGDTDLMYGIDELATTIKEKFDLRIFETGVIFLFCGRQNDWIKILVWQGDGLLLLYKRLKVDEFK